MFIINTTTAFIKFTIGNVISNTNPRLNGCSPMNAGIKIICEILRTALPDISCLWSIVLNLPYGSAQAMP